MKQRFQVSRIQGLKSAVRFLPDAQLLLIKETDYVFCFAWRGHDKLPAGPAADVLRGFSLRLPAIASSPMCTGCSIGVGAATGPRPRQAAGNSLAGLFEAILGFSSHHSTLLAKGIGTTGFWQLAAHRRAHAPGKDLSFD
jgi:hypothetical protein